MPKFTSVLICVLIICKTFLSKNFGVNLANNVDGNLGWFLLFDACSTYRGVTAFKAIKLKTLDRDLLKLGGAIVAALSLQRNGMSSKCRSDLDLLQMTVLYEPT
jgi:hypothetical protein